MPAELCPVCRGSGKLDDLACVDSTACNVKVMCHGCDGKGWVDTYHGLGRCNWPREFKDPYEEGYTLAN